MMLIRPHELIHSKEIRKELNLTQEEVARALDMKQASVSKLENQEDMYLSTFRPTLRTHRAKPFERS